MQSVTHPPVSPRAPRTVPRPTEDRASSPDHSPRLGTDRRTAGVGQPEARSADNTGMPRVARQHAPRVVTHVITRFVDGQYLMDEVPGAREQYLRRLAKALAHSDWPLLWYCLMGSHVHLGMPSGHESLDSWIRGLNSGFASSDDA